MDNRILMSLARLRFLRTHEKLFLFDCVSDEGQFLHLSVSRMARLLGRKVRGGNWDSSAALQQAEADLNYIEKRGICWSFYWDRDYPPQLREIYDPPFLLFYNGTLTENDKPAVSAVGTRKPTGKALKAAYHCGLEFGLNGISTISGLARGIDKAVHQGSIDADGKTIAVLGCGIDRIYPKEHAAIAENIIGNGGAVISEYAPGVPPARYNFPERNRIISGLSRTVIIIQSPEKSGALITADYALEQGRELVVHKDGLEGRAGKGGRRLAEEGAPVVESMQDILADWGESPKFTAVSGKEAGISEPAGIMMARLLEKELTGKLITRMGEYWEVHADY